MLWRAIQWVRTGNANSKGGVRTVVSNKVVKDFPGSPVVEIHAPNARDKMQGAQVRFPVRELRFCMLHTMAKRRKRTNK